MIVMIRQENQMKRRNLLVLPVLTTFMLIAWSTTVLSIPNIADPTGMRGQRLHNLQGEDLGRIEDVTAGVNGQPELIILSVMDNKFVAVPYSALAPSSSSDKLVVNITKDQIRSAPGLSLSQRQNLNSLR